MELRYYSSLYSVPQYCMVPILVNRASASLSPIVEHNINVVEEAHNSTACYTRVRAAPLISRMRQAFCIVGSAWPSTHSTQSEDWHPNWLGIDTRIRASYTLHCLGLTSDTSGTPAARYFI